MAGRNIDARDAMQFADRKGKLGSRPQCFKHICLNAVGCQTKCRKICKFRRHSSGIISDSNTSALSSYTDYVVSQSLSCLAHHVFIHAVSPRANDPAKSGCPKFQISVEAFFDLLLIICNGFKLRLGFFIKTRICEPFLIRLLIVHFITSCVSLSFLYNILFGNNRYCNSFRKLFL